MSDDWNAMSDRERDAWIAEKVMGWGQDTYNRWSEEFRPTSDISAAWEVVEKMKGMIFSKRDRFAKELRGTISIGLQLKQGQLIDAGHAIFYITPAAICEAAFRAMKGKSE